MLINKKRLRTVFCVGSLLLSSQVCAERSGYSMLGIGFESVSYEENLVFPDYIATQALRGVETVSDYDGINWSQRAGAYIAINEQWGFYINNSSTLGSQSHTETWELDGLRIQTNSMTLSRGDTNIWLSRQFQPKHHVLFGGTYNRIDYRRFNITRTALPGQDFENFSDATISEEVAEFIAEVGYEYNEMFTSKDAGWRTQLQILAGVPIYTHVRNTELDADSAFTDSFSGYNLRATASIGYQFSANVTIAGTLEAHYQYRNGDARQNPTSALFEFLPDRSFMYLQPSLNAMWSF